MIASPPSTRPSKISAFARAMASTLSKLSECTAHTAVTTATVGRASPVSTRICPALSIPISMTACSVSRGMRARVRGTPIWLFRLPSVACVLPTTARPCASMAFVVVLPTDPVTPMTRAVARSRPRAATARPFSACSVSCTSTWGPSTGRDTTATPPLRNTSPTKSWPSLFGPMIATNRSPRWTNRLSMWTVPVTVNGAHATP
mmetsp:Transcript_72819/g.122014  ORF Transcript_72819/g.122014 Transcript_72819/m.122014 type:complete len:203 (+) Transcript_72819:1506-2114(+)